MRRIAATALALVVGGCADNGNDLGDTSGGKNDDGTTRWSLRGQMPGDSLQLKPRMGPRAIAEVDLDAGEFGPIDTLTLSVYFVDPETGGPRAEPVTPNAHISLHHSPVPGEQPAAWESDDTATSWFHQFTPEVPETSGWSFVVDFLSDEPLPVMLEMRADSPGWRARETVDLPEVEPNNVDLALAKRFKVADWEKNCQNFNLASQPRTKLHFAFRGTLHDGDDVDCYYIDPRRDGIMVEILEQDDQLDLFHCEANGVCTQAIGIPTKRTTLLAGSLNQGDRDALVVRSRDGKPRSYSLVLDELVPSDLRD